MRTLPWAVHGPSRDTLLKREIPFSMCLCGAQVGSRLGGGLEALRQSTTRSQSMPSVKRSQVRFASGALTSCGLVQKVGSTCWTILYGPSALDAVALTILEFGVQYASPQSFTHSDASREYVPSSAFAIVPPQLLPFAPWPCWKAYFCEAGTKFSAEHASPDHHGSQ